MKCFLFRAKEKKVEQGTTQSISYESGGSDIRSQTISSTSSESIARPSYPSFSRRPNDLRVFTYVELKSATKNFSKSAVLGEGGFGCVYRGLIKNLDEKKVDIAVKKLGGRGMQVSTIDVPLLSKSDIRVEFQCHEINCIAYCRDTRSG